MKTVVFEDSAVWELNPITMGRPAFAITCGTMRLLDILNQLDTESISFLCRPYLEATSSYEYPDSRFCFGITEVCWELESSAPEENVLLVNARMVPDVRIIPFLKKCMKKGAPVFYLWQDIPACVCLPAAQLLKAIKGIKTSLKTDVLPINLKQAVKKCPEEYDHPFELFDYPHDVVRNHMELFARNLAYRLKHTVPALTGKPEKRWTSGKWTEIREGVFVGEGVKLGEYLVTDTSKGPILVDEGASIGPFCFLKGPVYIGPNSKVIEHAALKEEVGLAHTTKVGGEVEASSIEPYTNKQHHGFLGHSYLGSWINLGAGTCNSDLKNTYGSVSMQYKDGRVATAMQFHGCIIGDYAKTAINTSIFTGKTIGSCSMVYGFVTRNVPSFTNYARSFNQCTELPVEVMISTQKRMFARRNVTQEQCHIDLLNQMFLISANERQMENEPLSL